MLNNTTGNLKFWLITTKWAAFSTKIIILVTPISLQIEIFVSQNKVLVTVFQNVMPNLPAEQNLACGDSIPIQGVFSIFWKFEQEQKKSMKWGVVFIDIFAPVFQFVCGQNVDKALRTEHLLWRLSCKSVNGHWWTSTEVIPFLTIIPSKMTWARILLYACCLYTSYRWLKYYSTWALKMDYKCSSGAESIIMVPVFVCWLTKLRKLLRNWDIW